MPNAAFGEIWYTVMLCNIIHNYRGIIRLQLIIIIIIIIFDISISVIYYYKLYVALCILY